MDELDLGGPLARHRMLLSEQRDTEQRELDRLFHDLAPEKINLGNEALDRSLSALARSHRLLDESARLLARLHLSSS